MVGLPGPYGWGPIFEVLFKGQSHFAKIQARESGDRGPRQGGQSLRHLGVGIHNLISGRWQRRKRVREIKGIGYVLALFP